MTYTIHTDLDTLSEAWTLLNEVGLAGLFLHQKLDVDPQELLAQLLVQKKLKRFISIITHIEEPDLPALELSDVSEIISNFFIDFTRNLTAFGGVVTGQIGTQSPA